MSEEKDGSTEYYRVYKVKNDNLAQGFIYHYVYPSYIENNDGELVKKYKHISSVDIDKLRKRIESLGLPWGLKEDMKDLNTDLGYACIRESKEGFKVSCPPLCIKEKFNNPYDAESYLETLKELNVKTKGFKEDPYWERHSEYLEEQLSKKENVKRGEFQW